MLRCYGKYFVFHNLFTLTFIFISVQCDDDFLHFTEVLGNGGVVKHIAIVNFRVTPTSSLHTPNDAGLSVGVNQGPVSNLWRAKWVVTDASTDNASFTFSISVSSAIE